MAHEQLDALLDLGVNFIDTAEMMLGATVFSRFWSYRAFVLLVNFFFRVFQELKNFKDPSSYFIAFNKVTHFLLGFICFFSSFFHPSIPPSPWRYPVPFEGGRVTEKWIGTWLSKSLKEGKVQREKCLGSDGPMGMVLGCWGWWWGTFTPWDQAKLWKFLDRKSGVKQAEEWILIDFINKNGDINSQQLYFTTQLVVFFINKSGEYKAEKMRWAWGVVTSWGGVGKTSEVLHREQSVGSPEGRDSARWRGQTLKKGAVFVDGPNLYPIFRCWPNFWSFYVCVVAVNIWYILLSILDGLKTRCTKETATYLILGGF